MRSETSESVLDLLEEYVHVKPEKRVQRKLCCEGLKFPELERRY